MNVAPYQKESGSGLWQQVAMSVTTNAAGDYDLGGLKAGTYRLGFATYMTGGFLPEYWDDAATVGAATDIVVGASATVAGRTPSSPRRRTSPARSPVPTGPASRA